MSVPRATEAEWYENVRALARCTGWSLYHTRDARGSAAGFPDCVLLKPPVVLYRELKLAGRRPTPSQRSWLDGLVACGQDAKVWVFPDAWDEVVATLTGRNAR